MEEEYRLRIKIYTGETFDVDASATDTILNVKERICEIKNYDIGDLRLSFSATDQDRTPEERSRELANNQTLKQCNVQDDDELDLMLIPGIKFCEGCNNMLHPRENVEAHRLEYFCRNCKRSHPTDMHCVFRKESTQQNVHADRLADLVHDPTLHKTREETCPQCSHDEVVIYRTTHTGDERALGLYHVCCNPSCLHRWEMRDHLET